MVPDRAEARALFLDVLLRLAPQVGDDLLQPQSFRLYEQWVDATSAWFEQCGYRTHEGPVTGEMVLHPMHLKMMVGQVALDQYVQAWQVRYHLVDQWLFQAAIELIAAAASMGLPARRGLEPGDQFLCGVPIPRVATDGATPRDHSSTSSATDEREASSEPALSEGKKSAAQFLQALGWLVRYQVLEESQAYIGETGASGAKEYGEVLEIIEGTAAVIGLTLREASDERSATP